jgi:hypothetical protein
MQHVAVNDPYQWAYEIIKFFEINSLYDREKESIRKIENFFKNCKKVFLKNKIQKMVCQL